MSNYQWSSESFQAEALRAALNRKEAARREEQERQARARRAREERFVSLLAPVFGDRWSRVQEQYEQQRPQNLDTQPFTELRYGELFFALVDVEGQREPVLSVSAQCSTCGQTFEHHPVKDRADVGDVLAKLQHHPNCVHPEVRAEVERRKKLAQHALNL